jgi:carboxyl-terminal processing protease
MRFRPLRLSAAVLTLSFCPLLPAATSDDDVQASIKKFTQVYEAVEANFADKVDSESAVYKGAIPAMLRTLDPHSSFFDPKANELFRENQAGRYFGVGMYIWAPEGHVIVNYPFVGSPAFRAGLRPGDSLVTINDKSTEKLSVSEVSALLKGPRGTPAQILVKRVGSKEPITFNVIRDAVPRDSVTFATYLKPGVAYIKIESFNENTGKEVDRALAKLDESKIQSLVLDLRDNPGGLVSEAVSVADRFLHKGQGIVSHKGRASSEAKFMAKKGERGPEFPMVVLVNRGTASAAEILSGALQDHDRAWILGDSTFGKGLVQAPFPLTGNSTLLLTIAKYYTPSGRLIQRDYSHTSFYEYYSRKDGHANLKDAKKTDSGRTVFGGDGITPDENYVAPKLSRLQQELLGRLVFFYYTPEFLATHAAPASKDWVPGPEVMDEFKKYAIGRKTKVEAADWDRDRKWIQEQVRESIFTTVFSKEEADRVGLDFDPDIQKGIASLPQSKLLLDKVKSVLAKR